MAGRIRIVEDEPELVVEYDRLPAASAPAAVTMDVDTLVDRPDLSPGCMTFVRAGDTIRGRLTRYPRRPV